MKKANNIDEIGKDPKSQIHIDKKSVLMQAKSKLFDLLDELKSTCKRL